MGAVVVVEVVRQRMIRLQALAISVGPDTALLLPWLGLVAVVHMPGIAAISVRLMRSPL